MPLPEIPATGWRGDRLRLVRDGSRNQGQQVMEVVLITARPLGKEEAEAEFARLAKQVIVKNERCCLRLRLRVILIPPLARSGWMH